MTVSLLLKMNESTAASALLENRTRLDAWAGEVILDFSAMRRIDAATTSALQEFSDVAHGQGVRVVLRSVNVDIYKVLKLMKLTAPLSFAN
jgi:ABC-type transporter Mla MlaB component